MNTGVRHPSSFRDPSGFIFSRDGVLYRQVNRRYQPHYTRLMESGLYDALVADGLLIPHEEASLELALTEEACAVLRPERLPFISYPYEWCFSQLRDAALLTLRIQQRALDFGMSLQDASAYNIQFYHGAPILIDTLSFELERPDAPWVAYRQYCQHFLAPLALMSQTDMRLGKLLRVYLDGIPLALASSLLPWQTRISRTLGIHLHWQAKFEQSFTDAPATTPTLAVRQEIGMSRAALQGMLDHLHTTIKELRWEPKNTDWGAYYTFTNYSERAFAHKRELVTDYLAQVQPQTCWDLGANDGTFTRLASEQGIESIAFDLDPEPVEYCYRRVCEQRETNLLPLVIDLTNPSAAIGWHGRERQSLIERGPADCLLALALVHHLAIGNNLPFSLIAAFLRDLGRMLIIEFVPKTDSQVQRMLATRDDIFADYTREQFEQQFTEYFTIQACTAIEGSERVLYLMSRV